MPEANRELLMEGVDQSVRLLPPGYECAHSSELQLVLGDISIYRYNREIFTHDYHIEGTNLSDDIS